MNTDIFASTYEPVETTLVAPSFPAQPTTELRPLPEPPAIDAAQPKRRPYNASGSLSEYGIFPECDAATAAQLAPGEWIVDGVGRSAALQREEHDGKGEQSMTMNVQLVDELREIADWFRLRGLNENAALLDHAAHTVQCAVGRIERDEALLRQALEALEALERGAWDTLRGRNAAAAIRERLGEEE